MRIIVTAGPTREYIDDVRFISNPSSGRMGYAVAAEAAKRGHEVVLLSGPVCLAPPESVAVRHFETVDQLYDEVRAALESADCLVMAAAVGDYAPKERIAGKHKKGATMTLELVPTRDVLKSVAEDKGRRVFVGFAVEAADAVANARRKVEEKSLDMLVLNSPESFGADSARFTLLFPGGRARDLGTLRKSELARLVLDEIEALRR